MEIVIIRIEKSTNGHDVLVWHKNANESLYDSQAIAKAMTLEQLMDENTMGHVEYLVKNHYPEAFQAKALTDFEEEKQRKVKNLVKKIFSGNFSAAKWLFCHPVIARENDIARAGRELKSERALKRSKIEHLDDKTRKFIKDVFHIDGWMHPLESKCDLLSIFL